MGVHITPAVSYLGIATVVTPSDSCMPYLPIHKDKYLKEKCIFYKIFSDLGDFSTSYSSYKHLKPYKKYLPEVKINPPLGVPTFFLKLMLAQKVVMTEDT